MRIPAAGLWTLALLSMIAAPLRGVEPPDAGEPVTVPARPQQDEKTQKVSHQRGFWEGQIGLAASRDSNPSLLSEDLSVSVPTSNQTVKGAEGDTAASLDLRLAFHRLASEDSAHPWNAGWMVEARQSLYQDLDFLNLGEARSTVQVAWGRTPLGYLSGPLGPARVPVGMSRFAALVQTGVSYTLLDGDSYLRILTAAASLRLRETSALATRLDIELLDQSFADEPAVGRRSGEEVRLGLSQYVFLGREDRYLRLEAMAGERRAGKPFAGSLLRGGAELALPLARPWTLSLAATWQEDDFDHPESDLFAVFSPFDPEFEPGVRGRPRRDTVVRGLAALSWVIPAREDRKLLVATARFSWVERDSSLGTLATPKAYDYDRTIASLGLSWGF